MHTPWSRFVAPLCRPALGAITATVLVGLATTAFEATPAQAGGLFQRPGRGYGPILRHAPFDEQCLGAGDRLVHRRQGSIPRVRMAAVTPIISLPFFKLAASPYGLGANKSPHGLVTSRIAPARTVKHNYLPQTNY
jgi:hypothetical protein